MIMKKRFKELNDGEIREFVDSSDSTNFFEENLFFIEQLLHGKLFFNQEKIKHLREILPMFFGKSIVFYRNEMIQDYVDQYNQFKSQILEDFPNIFQSEEELTRQNIFNKKNMVHPIENVKKSVLFYGESTGSELMSQIGKHGREALEINSRAGNLNFSEIEAFKFLRYSFGNLKKEDNHTLDHLQNFIKNTENYPAKEKFSEEINHIQILNQLKISTLNRLKKIPAESLRNFLLGILDTQSHIEYFCRYFHRLVHIKKHGNLKYGKEYYQYYSKKKFDDKKFRKTCKKELNDFPELQKFLRRYCITFKRLRNIRAHQIPDDVNITPGGFISFQVIGEKKRREIDYREKREKMIVYGVFINKIKLHLQSPYNESEDVFVSWD